MRLVNRISRKCTFIMRLVNQDAQVMGIMSPPLWWVDILFVSCPSVCLSVTQFVGATPLKLLNRISWHLVGSKDTICSCTYHQEILITWLCGSYAPLNLEISRNLLLKQLVSTTPLQLLNRISWNLVGSKDTICSCAYYQEILISWILWELCFFEIRNFPKFTTEAVVSATPLKLLNRISWNLVGTKDTIFSRAYYQEIWSPKLCGSYLQTL
jgi:hypothetical protein